MAKLSDKAMLALRPDRVKMQICIALGISYNTFRRWLKSDHEKLTLPSVIMIISDYTKFSEEELFAKSYCWNEESISKRCDKQCEQCEGQRIV